MAQPTKLNLAAEREALAQAGIHFPQNGRFMENTVTVDNGVLRTQTDFDATRNRYAMDALPSGLIGSNNVGFPVQYFNLIDPQIIETLYTPLNATKLLPEKKEGDFTLDYITLTVSEIAGDVTAYSDFTGNFQAGTNFTYPSRQTFRYQVGYMYGNLEVERAAAAKIQLVSQRQNAATTIMARAANKFYLYGVQGMNIYGILNAPELDAPIEPEEVTSLADGSTKLTTWAEKMTDIQGAPTHIYNDVIALYGEIATKTQGAVDIQGASFTLAYPPCLHKCLAATNNFKVSVSELLQGVMPGLKFVQVPELAAEEGNQIMLICDNAPGYGSPGYCIFTEKLRMSPVIADVNSYKQNMAGGTAGAIITRPMLIASMSGV